MAVVPLEFALSRVLDPLEGVQEEFPCRARVHGAIDARDVSKGGTYRLRPHIQNTHTVLK